MPTSHRRPVILTVWISAWGLSLYVVIQSFRLHIRQNILHYAKLQAAVKWKLPKIKIVYKGKILSFFTRWMIQCIRRNPSAVYSLEIISADFRKSLVQIVPSWLETCLNINWPWIETMLLLWLTSLLSHFTITVKQCISLWWEQKWSTLPLKSVKSNHCLDWILSNNSLLGEVGFTLEILKRYTGIFIYKQKQEFVIVCCIPTLDYILQ